ncbi:hypothetical protein V1318_01710 [Lysobacter sp. CCNWLW3]
MSRRNIAILVIATLVAMALVYWLGHDSSNEARAFLRALKSAL